MSDITMCIWVWCPLKKNCNRHTAKIDELNQSYFTEVPIINNKCEFFRDNKDYSVKIFNDDDDFNT